eukprot:618345-Pleurochrysis_carterae.AAC.2
MYRRPFRPRERLENGHVEHAKVSPQLLRQLGLMEDEALNHLVHVKGGEIDYLQDGGEGHRVDRVGGGDGLHAAGEERAMERLVGEQRGEVVVATRLLAAEQPLEHAQVETARVVAPLVELAGVVSLVKTRAHAAAQFVKARADAILGRRVA